MLPVAQRLFLQQLSRQRVFPFCIFLRACSNVRVSTIRNSTRARTDGLSSNRVFLPFAPNLRPSLSAPRGLLSDADERRLDTERIQKAIDQCGSGKAVELHGSGDRNVFLAAPFHLQPGVTLLIDANTVLYASRNPRDYDVDAAQLRGRRSERPWMQTFYRRRPRTA